MQIHNGCKTATVFLLLKTKYFGGTSGNSDILLWKECTPNERIEIEWFFTKTDENWS